MFSSIQQSLNLYKECLLKDLKNRKLGILIDRDTTHFNLGSISAARTILGLTEEENNNIIKEIEDKYKKEN